MHARPWRASRGSLRHAETFYQCPAAWRSVGGARAEPGGALAEPLEKAGRPCCMPPAAGLLLAALVPVRQLRKRLPRRYRARIPRAPTKALARPPAPPFPLLNAAPSNGPCSSGSPRLPSGPAPVSEGICLAAPRHHVHQDLRRQPQLAGDCRGPVAGVRPVRRGGGAPAPRRDWRSSLPGSAADAARAPPAPQVTDSFIPLDRETGRWVSEARGARCRPPRPRP
jgi:hypothetical protein